MARFKFTFKRLRMDLDEGAYSADDEFNFASDDEEDVASSTVAAVAAVTMPAHKLSATDTQHRIIFNATDGASLLQPSGKRQREIGSWERPGQWKQRRLGSNVQSEKPTVSVGTGLRPWGSWLGKASSPQRVSEVRTPSPVSRLAASVIMKRGGHVRDALSTKPSSGARTHELRAKAAAKPKLLVMRGDPTDWSTAAIVSDTNSLLHHNSGLAAAIVRKGGLEIQHQSTEWVYYHGEVPVGSAMWTTAGKLLSRFIIYTVGPDVRHHRWPSQRHQLELRRAVRSALNMANGLGVTSVAIPALCTGVSRYPKFLAAREIVAECLEFCDDCPLTALRLITLMNEDEVTTSIFVQAMKDAQQQ
ncbi:hypothetical protein PHYPSEUDO_003330 [Phytophthora pseudosyringae]|uniref:Macro domain-containing protein n=1 Tax=Phytophthora pseudosyringae TaxID=221518 RepID=A0A8T1VU77_9STRA|nr:hypothetical protein PHYPSEUDO_003330 [Phytophthora pseudosyringae]